MARTRRTLRCKRVVLAPKIRSTTHLLSRSNGSATTKTSRSGCGQSLPATGNCSTAWRTRSSDVEPRDHRVDDPMSADPRSDSFASPVPKSQLRSGGHPGRTTSARRRCSGHLGRTVQGHGGRAQCSVAASVVGPLGGWSVCAFQWVHAAGERAGSRATVRAEDQIVRTRCRPESRRLRNPTVLLGPGLVSASSASIRTAR